LISPHLKVARTEKEICSLIEAGFEYVTEFDGAKIFRKCKLLQNHHPSEPPHTFCLYWCRGWDSDPQHAGDIANSSYYTHFLPIFLEVKQTKNISVASE
jgi:hypothetical protein